MKKGGKVFIVLLGVLFFLPSLAQSQPDKILERFFERLEQGIRPEDLRVLQLEISPDPVGEGQRVSFQVTISNLSRFSGRASFFVKDRDEVITEVYEVILRPGNDRIIFPQTNYRFSRYEHCFTVEVDIERTRRAVDVAKEYCAQRTYQGWTLTAPRVGPLFVENLEMFPDPVSPGQEVRFRVRLRNDGNPLRGNIRIQDRNQIVAQLNDLFLPRGYSEYHFPYTRYQFQGFDHCFTVIVDVERTPYRIDAAREFCAKPLGWTLRP